MEVNLDFETRSLVDLKKAGAYRYAQDPSTDVWCAAFSVDGDEPALWTPETRISRGWTLGELAADPTITWRAWNAPFERVIWRWVMVRKYGFPDIPLERWYCTAAEARAMNLPNALEKCAQALGLKQQKDMAGHRLMLQMCRPRDVKPDGTIVWWDDPEKVARLGEYCKGDVLTEQAAKRFIQPLSEYERRIWMMDQRANDRGIMLDTRLATAAKDMAAKVGDKANEDIEWVTEGAVSKVSNVGRLKDWLAANDIVVDSLNKKTVAKLLDDDDLPRHVREALELRVAAGKSSVKKIEAMLKAVCTDGFLRGLLLYHGAGTGRWAGRLVQPQNFPARTGAMPEWYTEGLFDAPEHVVQSILRGDVEALELEGPPLEIIAMLLRMMLVARPGKVLVAADYSAIEARVIAWLCKCQWRLDVFRTHGKIYEASASQTFKVPLETIAKGQPNYHLRQKGKVTELALGFQGGKNAMIAMGALDGGLKEDDLPDLVKMWREANPELVQGWYDLDDACKNAVRHPGTVTSALFGRVRMKVSGDFLWLRLPSGRLLSYAGPRIVMKPAPWDATTLLETVMVWSVNSKTKKWSQHSLFGGILMNNVVQGTARDFMADAMLRLDQGGKYDPLLSVHDEAIAEADEDKADVSEFEAIMCDLPAWADGCPVKADGWAGRRYRK